MEKDDIDKAKRYKTIHNTDYSVIVMATDITDKNSSNSLIEGKEGIWLVNRTIAVEAAKLLRSFIIKMSKMTISNKERTSKQAKLYERMTSMEYTRTIQQRRDIKSKLDDLQKREEDYHKKLWKKRCDEIEEWDEIDELNQQIIDEIVQEQTSIQTENNIDDNEGEIDQGG